MNDKKTDMALSRDFHGRLLRLRGFAIVPKPIPQMALLRGDIGMITWDHGSEGQTDVYLEAYSPVVNIVAVRPLRAIEDDDPSKPPAPPIPSEVLDTEAKPEMSRSLKAK
jgi:hypothetical protein